MLALSTFGDLSLVSVTSARSKQQKTCAMPMALTKAYLVSQASAECMPDTQRGWSKMVEGTSCLSLQHCCAEPAEQAMQQPHASRPQDTSPNTNKPPHGARKSLVLSSFEKCAWSAAHQLRYSHHDQLVEEMNSCKQRIHSSGCP